MTTPLPSPSSLLSALDTLERAIANYERGREDKANDTTKASSDGKITVTVSGIGRVKAVAIDQSQLALTPVDLATKVKTVANTAIDAAYEATRATIAAFASALGMPGLPAYGLVPPDYLDFVPTADTVAAQILANNPCEGTTTYTCTSGPVTAVVNRRRQVVSLTYGRYPRFASALAQRTLEALNCAVDKATDPPELDPKDAIPQSRGLHDLVIYAKGTLKLNDRVLIKGQNCSGWGNIANAGTVETNIGVEAQVANLLSKAKVVLRDRAKVHGFLTTENVLENHTDTVVDGPISEHDVVILPDLVLNVPFPGVQNGTIELEPGQQQTAAPGYYNKIHPKQNAQVFLSSGVYYFNEFFLEPSSTVWLNTTSGPVICWVRDTFTFRGSVLTSGSGGFPRFFAGYLGTTNAIVESAWKGTLAAPNAKISVSTIQNHEGAFHGKNVEVQPDCGVCHKPFELHYDQLPGTVPPGGLPPATVDLSFETSSGWSSPQATLTLVSSPVTHGSKSLQISGSAGLKEVVSANFPATLAPQGCTRMIVDVRVPTGQTSGNLSVVINIPSAGVNNVNLGNLNFTGHTTNQFTPFEFALPTAVRTALDGSATDVSIKIVFSSASGAGPWYIDNARFLLPVAPLSSLDPILSFEDTTKWSSTQTTVSGNTQFKTHLTKSLRVTTAPGWLQLVSAPFTTGPLNAPLGKFRIDLRKPNPTQPNPSWHGQFQLQIDVPSAGISNATTGTVELTPLAANAFVMIELALPSNVVSIVNSEFDDMKLKLTLNVVAGSGPWHVDNIRFV
jgi:DNA-binding protein YbaB